MEIEKYRYTAHRGLYDSKKKIPENSMLAFQKAIENQFAIELDVHLTKDHQVVVFHDDNMKRMTKKEARIEDCTYEELQDLTLQETTQKIPLLQEVLDLVKGRVGMIIEIKNNRKVGPLERLVTEMLQSYTGDYMVESFNPFTVWWLKKHTPHIIRGQLSDRNESAFSSKMVRYLFGKMIFNPITKPDFIAYKIEDITPSFYEKYQRKGITVVSWTIRSEVQAKEAFSRSDAIIFENFIPKR